MLFTKGYTTESGFIPESSQIKVVLGTGEVLEGILSKPAKKEFRLIIGDVARVLNLAEVESLELV